MKKAYRPVLWICFCCIGLASAAFAGNLGNVSAINPRHESYITAKLALHAAPDDSQAYPKRPFSTTPGVEAKGSRMRITGSITRELPENSSLKIAFHPPKGKSSAGYVPLSTMPQRLTTGTMQPEEILQSLAFKLSHSSATNELKPCRCTVLLTVTD